MCKVLLDNEADFERRDSKSLGGDVLIDQVSVVQITLMDEPGHNRSTIHHEMESLQLISFMLWVVGLLIPEMPCSRPYNIPLLSVRGVGDFRLAIMLANEVGIHLSLADHLIFSAMTVSLKADYRVWLMMPLCKVGIVLFVKHLSPGWLPASGFGAIGRDVDEIRTEPVVSLFRIGSVQPILTYLL